MCEPQEIQSTYQILSDLHLDIHERRRPSSPWQEWKLLEPTCDNLLLAGDIAEWNWAGWQTFVEFCTKRWKRVLMVEGNHEWYGTRDSKDQRDQRIKQVQEWSSGKFVVLDRTRFCEDEKDPASPVVLGCTLWSCIPAHAENHCSLLLNDFRKIHGFLSVADYNDKHQVDYQWLDQQIKATDPARPLIIMTHHAPLSSGTSDPKYEKDPDHLINFAFANDMSDDFDRWFHQRKHATRWVFGHTHWCCDFRFKNVDVTSFQVGYPGEIQHVQSAAHFGYDTSFNPSGSSETA